MKPHFLQRTTWCFICVIACIFLFTLQTSSAQIEADLTIDMSQAEIQRLQMENDGLKRQVGEQKRIINSLEQENVVLEEERDNALEALAQKEAEDAERAAKLENFEEIDILAKLLYCEAGGMGYEGQLWVCSAILNLSDYTGRSVWNLAHDEGTMAVAPYVDYARPTAMQYEVIRDVFYGSRIEDVCYFRTLSYHTFGTPMVQIENVFFSAP